MSAKATSAATEQPTRGAPRTDAPQVPAAPAPARPRQPRVPETGGPPGPEPTRYGDWEKGGRCTDF
jgi:hypothetical protein